MSSIRLDIHLPAGSPSGVQPLHFVAGVLPSLRAASDGSLVDFRGAVRGSWSRVHAVTGGWLAVTCRALDLQIALHNRPSDPRAALLAAELDAALLSLSVAAEQAAAYAEQPT